jgi:L-threonylcarbamoyladenylate synthase
MFDKTTIPKLAASLNEGGVAVIPTDTIYGVVTQAANESAVEKIYKLKQRTPSKPFIILIDSFDDVTQFGVELVDTLKDQLSHYWPGPVSIILECKNPHFEYLHRGTQSLAFRFPDNENLRNLIELTGPLVAPSANPEGLSPAKTIKEAEAYFPEGIDMFLEGPTNETPSKIIRILGNDIEVIRG